MPALYFLLTSYTNDFTSDVREMTVIRWVRTVVRQVLSTFTPLNC